MSLENILIERSGHKCEVCESNKDSSVFALSEDPDENNSALLCGLCIDQINDSKKIDVNHWRSLNSAIWSEQEAVKIIAYHMLNNLKGEAWAVDLLEQIYLEEEALEKAKRYHAQHDVDDEKEFALDSNGTKIYQGDSVTLIKDLDVKGANFTAKRGTLVKGISLTGDTANIEGKINGTQIVLKTMFLKKA